MKLTIDRAALAAALAFVARMSPKRTTQPILSGVLLRAEPGKLTLTIYDYEVAAETVLDADVDAEGIVLVHAATFSQIAGKLPKADVALELSESRLEVRCGKVRAGIALMPAENYPQPVFASSPLLAMSGFVFEDAVRRVAVAAASSAPEKPIILGVNVEVDGKRVTMTATDRYRIASMELGCEAGRDGSVVIPAFVLREAAKVFATSERVEIGVTEREAVTIRGDRGVMLTTTLAGEYPPVTRLFPRVPFSTVKAEADALAESVARAALAVEGDSPIEFTFSQEGSRVESRGDGKGISEALEVEFDGDESSMRLVPQRVLEGIAACGASQFEVWLSEPKGRAKMAPVMFTARDGFRYLLQPVMDTGAGAAR